MRHIDREVVVRVTGGLGNQLFQYATGRALAIRLGVPLKLDLGHYRRESHRRFALDPFCIEAEEASAQEVRALMRDSLWRRMARRALPSEKAPGHRAVFTESSYAYDRRILDLSPPVYLIGYWQSPRYFAAVESSLRQELRWKLPPTGPAAEILAAIRADDAVAIHMRRGDYVNDPQVRERFGVCTSEYYRRAVSELAHRRTLTKAFVFSDEPEGVRDELRLGLPTVLVSALGLAPHEDLRLLSACPNKVLSNSSFSWWSAWLGEGPQQKVAAPARWFRSEDLPDKDLVPAGWLRV